jgi:hypothetical protein
LNKKFTDTATFFLARPVVAVWGINFVVIKPGRTHADLGA